MNTDRRTGFASAWLAGLTLGSVIGLAWLSLGTLMLPFLAASFLLLMWKGLRLAGGAGFVTGFGLVWIVLFARVALTCGGPLDSGADGVCDAGDMRPWFAIAGAILAVGLAGSVAARRRRP
jgi:hypothetical protein